jgi:hypothetical protein
MITCPAFYAEVRVSIDVGGFDIYVVGLVVIILPPQLCCS